VKDYKRNVGFSLPKEGRHVRVCSDLKLLEIITLYN
jgi:hypothetical protein